jgi:hypothetical protein
MTIPVEFKSGKREVITHTEDLERYFLGSIVSFKECTTIPSLVGKLGYIDGFLWKDRTIVMIVPDAKTGIKTVTINQEGTVFAPWMPRSQWIANNFGEGIFLERSTNRRTFLRSLRLGATHSITKGTFPGITRSIPTHYVLYKQDFKDVDYFYNVVKSRKVNGAYPDAMVPVTKDLCLYWSPGEPDMQYLFFKEKIVGNPMELQNEFKTVEEITKILPEPIKECFREREDDVYF